jgi:hypothetical protein
MPFTWRACWIPFVGLMLASCGSPVNRSGMDDPPGGREADRVYRARDEGLHRRFTDAASRCATRWFSDAGCHAVLVELREEESRLFADVRAHRFSDITESNYWHRGRLKFPSEIEQLARPAVGR